MSLTKKDLLYLKYYLGIYNPPIKNDSKVYKKHMQIYRKIFDINNKIKSIEKEQKRRLQIIDSRKEDKQDAYTQP